MTRLNANQERILKKVQTYETEEKKQLTLLNNAKAQWGSNRFYAPLFEPLIKAYTELVQLQDDLRFCKTYSDEDLSEMLAYAMVKRRKLRAEVIPPAKNRLLQVLHAKGCNTVEFTF